jgi:hypothetical protein
MYLDKTLNKLILAIVLSSIFFFMIGCQRDCKATVATDNPNFHVVLLFETDGCKVYRFSDSGYTLYFTTCQGSVQYADKYGTHRIETTIMPDTTNKLNP